MRILQIITGLNVGGAQRVLFDMARNFNPEKYEVLVCYLKEEGLVGHRMREKGIRVLNMKMKGFFDFRVIFKLARLIRREGIDLVHTHLARADAVGCLAAKIAGVPVISTRHNTYEPWERNFLLTYLYHLILSPMDAIIAVSESAKDYLASWARVDEKKVRVIPNGVDLDEFNPVPRDADSKKPLGLKKSTGLSPDSTLVGTIGRLDDLKGQDHFLEAAALVAKVRPEARFMIVGDGPEKETLTRLSVNLGLGDRVLFTGWREDIPGLLAAMDVFVQSSHREGLGLAVLEAMACARPVVATKVDGLPELIEDGETGLLVNPGEPEGLAQGIIFLLGNKDVARRMGQAARNKARKRFDLKEMTRQIQELYETVLR